MAQVSLTRELVMQMLLSVSQEEHYSHLVLRETLDKYQFLPKQDRAFITRTFEGTIENRIKIDYWINQVSSVKVNKMKPVIREIIRSAVYQIVYMDSVPDSAACNDAEKRILQPERLCERCASQYQQNEERSAAACEGSSEGISFRKVFHARMAGGKVD